MIGIQLRFTISLKDVPMNTIRISRLLGIITLFLITTGQASTDGCEAPTPDASQETTPAASSISARDTSRSDTTEALTRAPEPETETRGPTDSVDRLRPGLWTGPVSCGYKGDSISFMVSADGQQIGDVTFSGYWRCKDGSSSFSNIKRMDVGHVPGVFRTGSDGSFSEEKREPYLLWTLAGQADGPARASGTVRIEYAAECDTFRLEWAAQPVR